MVAGEPRARRRGFFLHSETETEMSYGAEVENPEGFVVRVRVAKTSTPRQVTTSGRSSTDSRTEVNNPEIRSGSVTGSRQRGHLPR
jgi:hypothetical protein